MSDQDEKAFADPTEADIGAAKAKHRKVFTFETAGHTVLCKPISQPTWKRIQRILKDTESTEDVTDVILLDVLAYPTRDKIELLLEDFPGAFESVALDLINRAKGQEMKRGKAALRRSTRPGTPRGSVSPRGRSTPSSWAKTTTTPRWARCSSQSCSHSNGRSSGPGRKRERSSTT